MRVAISFTYMRRPTEEGSDTHVRCIHSSECTLPLLDKEEGYVRTFLDVLVETKGKGRARHVAQSTPCLEACEESVTRALVTIIYVLWSPSKRECSIPLRKRRMTCASLRLSNDSQNAIHASPASIICNRTLCRSSSVLAIDVEAFASTAASLVLN